MQNNSLAHHSSMHTHPPIFDGALEAIPDGLVILDSANRMVFVNAQTERMFAYSRKELLGQPLEILIAPRYRAEQATLLAEYSVAQNSQPIGGGLDLCGQRKNGSEFPLDARFNHLTMSDGSFVMGILHDVTALKQQDEYIKQQGRELREANAQLEELAMQDSLTGLKNHRAFRQKLQEEFSRAVRYQTPLSVLMLDIDSFKTYNDSFGHAAGDKVLQSVARLLQSIARTTDLVARYGGEEFIILLPYTGHAGATVLAERFRRAIEGAAWPERKVTISVGAATFEATPDGRGQMDATALLAAADRALYHSKEHGRNRSTHDNDLSPQTVPVSRPFIRKLLTSPSRFRSHHPFRQFEYGHAWLSQAIREENIFLFLLGVRWICLLPPLLTLQLGPPPGMTALLIFALALLSTIVLSMFQTKLNRLVLNYPSILLLDMTLSSAFIAFTGGLDSPYDRYARLPLLAAAFFFQIRGGIIAAATYTPLFLLALLFARQWSGAAANVQDVLTQIIIFFLLALVFGYPSVLLQRLRAATSQLHRAQQEAARAETLAAMGKMAAHVSHEIRNPLSTIGGFARSILRRPNDVERVRKNAQIIADEVARLEQLLTDMLDMARPPLLKLHPENLHDILDKAWLLSDGKAIEKSLITVRKDYDLRLPLLEADASALLRAFLNVTRNAVQMMPEGGTVTITTRLREDGEVEVVIADNGPGISPEVLPTIFKPFVSHRPNGTGLGLAATQRIIQDHGGHIQVQSEPGKGTRFIFHLPLKPVH